MIGNTHNIINLADCGFLMAKHIEETYREPNTKSHAKTTTL
jgi:hypothetical protein